MNWKVGIYNFCLMQHLCSDGMTRLEFEVEHLQDDKIEREEEVANISIDIDNK